MNLKFRLKKLISYFFPVVLEQVKGDISPYLEVVLSNSRVLLNASKCNYSYGKSYQLLDQVLIKMRIQDRRIESALILGLGCGDAASLLLEKYHKTSSIVGIEKDATVLKLASKYFNVERFNSLKIYSDDAFDFVNGCEQRFDLIIMDVSVEDYLPKHFHESRFTQRLENLLTERGVLIFVKVSKTPQQDKDLEVLKSNFSELHGHFSSFNFPSISVEKHFLVYAKTGFISTPLMTTTKIMKIRARNNFINEQGAYA
jgi:spermidine synthase